MESFEGLHSNSKLIALPASRNKHSSLLNTATIEAVKKLYSTGSWCHLCKTFYNCNLFQSRFVPEKNIHPSLIFAVKARSLPLESCPQIL